MIENYSFVRFSKISNKTILFQNSPTAVNEDSSGCVVPSDNTKFSNVGMLLK